MRDEPDGVLLGPPRQRRRCSASLASGLALAAVAGCIEQARPPADPEAAFLGQMGREWSLVRIGTREIPPPPPGTAADSPGVDLAPGRRPTIRFMAEPPSVGGRSFCNGYGGPFVLRGDSLRIEQIMSSAVGCDSADSLETRFFRGLRETRRFELDSTSLVLITDDGTRLAFVPATATTPGPTPR